MRRALSSLDKASRSFDNELQHFEALTTSMVSSDPGAELELENNQFKFLGRYKWRGTDFRWRFVQRANLASRIRDISEGDTLVYVECRKSKIASFEDDKTDIKLLNQKLATADRVVGIPQVLGFRVENPASSKADRVLQLVMSIPNITTEFESSFLKRSLAKPEDMPSLNVRVNLCVQLAEAVLHVHKMGLVHKNIRPENILVIKGKVIPGIIGSLYLVGWQAARRQQAATNKEGEIKWDLSIYQHPRRHGKSAKSKYAMEHDIYSLGVCMLEILQWKPLVKEINEKPVLSENFRNAFDRLRLKRRVRPRDEFETDEDWITQRHSVLKVLTAMVETEIPQVAGTRMANVISDCLNGRAIETREEQAEGEQAEGEQAEEEQAVQLSQEQIALSFVESILDTVRNVFAFI